MQNKTEGKQNQCGAPEKKKEQFILNSNDKLHELVFLDASIMYCNLYFVKCLVSHLAT